MEGLPSQTHGYPTDVPYVRTFFRSLAPAWLDHVAIVSGLARPNVAPGLHSASWAAAKG